MTNDDVEQAIFGASDGMTSALGVIIPLALAGHSMTVVIIGLAISASVGMGGGLYLSDGSGRLKSAIVMALATAIGTVLPALPFMLLPKALAVPLSVLIVIAIGQFIVTAKKQVVSTKKAYLETYGILITVSLLTVILTILTGSAA